eukprot:PRCOL_00001536-RA
MAAERTDTVHPTTGPFVGTQLDQSMTVDELQPFYNGYRTGYRSVPPSDETKGFIQPSMIEGQIPPELEGTLLRNGPAYFEREGDLNKRYLDGDGMVTSIAFKDGKAFFRNKFVQTECFKAEQEAGKYLEPSIFTAEDPRKPIWWHRTAVDMVGIDRGFTGDPQMKHNGAYNVINWGGSLVAVDYAKPYELDPKNLETIGHGASDLSSTMHTSHYRVMAEADGSSRLVSMLNKINWRNHTTTSNFCEFDEQGNKVKDLTYVFPAAYVHDMIVTDDYYVLFDCPVRMHLKNTFINYPQGKTSLSESIAEDTSRKPMFRLFPRHDGVEEKVIATDKFCFSYHHVNGWQEGDKLIFDTTTWPKFTLYFLDIVDADGKVFWPKMSFTRFVLDLKTGECDAFDLDNHPCEYPAVAPCATGRPYRHAYLCTSAHAAADNDEISGPIHQLTKVSMASADPYCKETKVEHYYPGDTRFCMEPLFIPRSQENSGIHGKGGEGEDDGWLIGLVNNAGSTTDCVIIDCKDFAAGPVCTLHLPRYVPMGVHGSWSPEYIAGPEPQDVDTEAISNTH